MPRLKYTFSGIFGCEDLRNSGKGIIVKKDSVAKNKEKELTQEKSKKEDILLEEEISISNNEKEDEATCATEDTCSSSGKVDNKRSSSMKDVPVYYSSNESVNPVGKKDFNDYIKNTEKKQDLPGFNDEYLDVVDYILRMTHKCWEERSIGIIYDVYHNDSQMHLNSSTEAGIASVIAGTLETMYSYPNRKLIAEDVIWSEDSPGVFYSSHREMTTATNYGPTQYGPATGKQLAYKSIADCSIKDGRIFEEWIARDSLSVINQLGLDPVEVATNMAKTMTPFKLSGMPEPMDGQCMPKAYKAADDSLGEMFKELLNDIYNLKLLNRVEELFTDNCMVHTVGGHKLVGHDEIQGNLVNFLSPFPNAKYTIERITCNDQNDGTHHVSVRYRLRGFHEGFGIYGAPTGNPITLLGITHYIMKDGKCIEAIDLYDVIDVMRQTINVAE